MLCPGVAAAGGGAAAEAGEVAGVVAGGAAGGTGVSDRGALRKTLGGTGQARRGDRLGTGVVDHLRGRGLVVLQEW